MTRRGGRHRLKASDSKSDRGVSPSGVQILSPPPLIRTSGGVTERPKVRHWKCRARVIPVPRVQIPPPPPLLIRRRSACAGLRRSTVGQRPPWSLRRSTVGRRPPWSLRRSTVGRRPPWLVPAPDGRRIDALDQF